MNSVSSVWKYNTVRCAIAITIFSSLTAVPATAQFPSKPRSYDIGTGFMMYRNGGIRHEALSGVISSQFAWRIKSNARSGLVVGANATGFASGSTTDDCVVPIDHVPGTEFTHCAPDPPSGLALSSIVGLEQILSSQLALRIVAGPGLVMGNERPLALGFQTRVDLASPATKRAGIVLWLQQGFTPSRYGTTSRMFTAGLGLRVR